MKNKRHLALNDALEEHLFSLWMCHSASSDAPSIKLTSPYVTMTLTKIRYQRLNEKWLHQNLALWLGILYTENSNSWRCYFNCNERGHILTHIILLLETDEISIHKINQYTRYTLQSKLNETFCSKYCVTAENFNHKL
jgi:hypothetical protein